MLEIVNGKDITNEPFCSLLFFVYSSQYIIEESLDAS